MFTRSILVMLAATLAGAGSAIGQEPSQPGADSHGDRLPPGAVARLGSLRFVHPGGIGTLAISPDARVIATGTAGSPENTAAATPAVTVRLWDATSGQLLREWPVAGNEPLNHLMFAPDGKVLFGGSSHFLLAWESGTGKPLWQQNYKEDLEGLQFIRGGERLVTFHQGNLARFWDAANGTARDRWQYFENEMPIGDPALFFSAGKAICSPDGKYLVVAALKCKGGTKEGWKFVTFHGYQFRLYDVEKKRFIRTVADRPHFFDDKLSLQFSPDGRILAFAEGTAVWFVDWAADTRYKFDTRFGYIYSFTFSPDGRSLWTFQDTPRCWDVATGKLLTTLKTELPRGGDRNVEVARDGKLLAWVCGKSRFATVWDLAMNRPWHDYPRNDSALPLQFNSDGTLLRHSLAYDQTFVWDTRTWKRKPGLPHPEQLLPVKDFHNLASSGESRLVLDADHEDQLLVRDWPTGKPLRQFKVQLPNFGERCGFSPDGNVIVRVGRTQMPPDRLRLQFYDAATGRLLSQVGANTDLDRFDGYDEFIVSPNHFSPAGDRFAYHQLDGRIVMVDIRAGKTVALIGEAKEERPGSRPLLRFSADGRWLLGWNEPPDKKTSDGQVRLWELETGRELPHLLPPSGTDAPPFVIGRFALSPNKRLIALTETASKTIHVWDVLTLQPRGTLTGHIDEVEQVEFSPDSRYLVSASRDTTVLVWDLHRPFAVRPFSNTLTERELLAHWDALGRPDAVKADTTVWSLVRAPGQSVPFLKAKLSPAMLPAAFPRWLDELSSKHFKARAAATAEIEKLGDLALPALLRAAEQNQSLEVKLRLQQLIAKAKRFVPPADHFRALRTLEVLERIGSVDARRLLEELAQGTPGVRLTDESRSCLERMGKAKD